MSGMKYPGKGTIQPAGPNTLASDIANAGDRFYKEAHQPVLDQMARSGEYNPGILDSLNIGASELMAPVTSAGEESRGLNRWSWLANQKDAAQKAYADKLNTLVGGNLLKPKLPQMPQEQQADINPPMALPEDKPQPDMHWQDQFIQKILNRNP